MNPNRNRQPDAHDEPQLPADLIGDLRALYPYPGSPPADRKADIYADAREQINNVRRHRRWGLWGSLAACVGFVFVLQHVMRDSAVPNRSPSETQSASPAPQMARRLAKVADEAATPADIDGNGRVDILDAYVMARGLANASTDLDPAWDINADGTIDQRDIDAVAQSAVRLKGGA